MRMHAHIVPESILSTVDSEAMLGLQMHKMLSNSAICDDLKQRWRSFTYYKWRKNAGMSVKFPCPDSAELSSMYCSWTLSQTFSTQLLTGNCCQSAFSFDMCFTASALLSSDAWSSRPISALAYGICPWMTLSLCKCSWFFFLNFKMC